MDKLLVEYISVVILQKLLLMQCQVNKGPVSVPILILLPYKSSTQQNTPFRFSCVLKLGLLETWDVNVSVSKAFWVTLCCLNVL